MLIPSKFHLGFKKRSGNGGRWRASHEKMSFHIWEEDERLFTFGLEILKDLISPNIYKFFFWLRIDFQILFLTRECRLSHSLLYFQAINRCRQFCSELPLHTLMIATNSSITIRRYHCQTKLYFEQIWLFKPDKHKIDVME